MSLFKWSVFSFKKKIDFDLWLMDWLSSSLFTVNFISLSDHTSVQFCTCSACGISAPCRYMHLQKLGCWWMTSAQIYLYILHSVHKRWKGVSKMSLCHYHKAIKSLLLTVIRQHCHVKGSSQTSFHTWHAHARLAQLHRLARHFWNICYNGVLNYNGH